MTELKYIWISLLDTRHFSFLSTGRTKEESVKAMRESWREHSKDSPYGDNWDEFEDSVYTDKYLIGAGHRDGHMIYPVWNPRSFKGHDYRDVIT